jgi:DNA recombination-dependent growth factor C
MGIYKGNATLSRYRVRGDLPAGFADFADEQINRFVFRSIDNTTDELGVGWVSSLDYLDTNFAQAGYMLDPYIVLGLRIDKRAVSGALLKKYHRLEIKKAVAMREDHKISRSDREDLKEKARLDLLRRIPPATQAVDVCWDTAKAEVWLGSNSKKVREIFEDLFYRTFELKLEPVLPWFTALRLIKDEERFSLEKAAPLNLYNSGE